MIVVRNVSKRFGKQVVLDNVSLHIKKGETVAVVGPSGVGKSVLLKLVMGLLEPDEGEVLVCGENITAAKRESAREKIRANLGVLFQSAALFDSLTLYENIAFPLLARAKLARHTVHTRVMKILKALGLRTHATAYPQEVSMGVRKRCGMARALITEPKVFLLDEPNTGLDPLDGQKVYELINKCREQWGFAGMVVSHELPEVFQVADRVVMLLHGEVIAEGTPEEFISSKNPAVEQFLKGKTDGPITIQ